MPVPPGTHFGRYKVRSLIAVGGMGEVYEAEDAQLGRTVALKVLPAEVACDQQRVQRFLQEGKAASALNHPNILTIYEIGRDGDTCYIVTEFIEGATLRQHVTARAGMTIGGVLDIAIQAAGALARAHEAGIVHRDVKPENIMVRSDGIVKVLDFGLAKLAERPASVADSEATAHTLVNTEPGTVLGTPLYMSPEQVRAQELDARTDIFSLGVVLYEMLGGRAPFEGPTAGDVIASIINREPAPLAQLSPDLPPELERIVMKALAKDREERYQVIKDLIIDLKALRRGLEFEAELDRTAPPELRGALSGSRGSAQTLGAPHPKSATGAAGAHRTTSAEPPVGRLRRHKMAVGLAVAALSLVVAAALFVHFSRARREALTEKDTILLADFVNT
ncbi:MAG TPA: serine/threonine-protein kinase, partial [Pyrinomonadaceae bacterium]|nr:serine/threonine-protein kinase [Pyrinomonadaceae bacterium]